MSGKRSPGAAVKIIELESYMTPVMRLNALVEQYASAKTGQDNITASMKRAADQLKLRMMMAGEESMSQIAGSIVMTIGRSGNQGTKTRALREAVGNLRFHLDLAMRNVIRDDDELQRANAEIKEKKLAGERAAERAAEKQAAELAEGSVAEEHKSAE